MRKTLIYLEEDQFLLLKKTAASSRKKMAEVVREAVSSYLKRKSGRKPDPFSFVGAGAGPKRGKASERAEETLREAFRSSS